MKRLHVIFGSLLTLSMLQIAHADPITLLFDSEFTGASYTESGMTIDATSEQLVVTDGTWNLPCCPGAGPDGVDSFALSTGGIFDLLSIDIIHVDFSDPVVWEGFLNGILVATNTFNTGQGSTFGFMGFSGLDLVTMSVSGTYTDPGFDNLTYEGVSIPEPGTLGLLGIGLLAIGWAKARKVF